MPRLKPPFPAIAGLYAKPTVVNNVETLSTVPHIIAMGGAEYAKIGVNKSTGTRIVAISGHVKKPGNYEVEFGMHVPRHDLRPRGRHPRRTRAQVLPARRRVVPVARRASTSTSTRRYDMDFVQQNLGTTLGSGAVMVFDETDRSGARRVAAREVLRARVVRQVHAVPRGHGLDREGALPHVARTGPARRPRPAHRRRRGHLAERRERAVHADDDLPARPERGLADREPRQVLPRRDRGPPRRRRRSAA